jgi:hypothetical protein
MSSNDLSRDASSQLLLGKPVMSNLLLGFDINAKPTELGKLKESSMSFVSQSDSSSVVSSRHGPELAIIKEKTEVDEDQIEEIKNAILTHHSSRTSGMNR